jgi:hypothetical protein
MLDRNGLYGAYGYTSSALYAAVIYFSFAVHHGDSLYGAGSHAGFASNTCIFVDLCCHKKFPPTKESMFHNTLTSIDRIIQYAKGPCNSLDWVFPLTTDHWSKKIISIICIEYT